MTRLLNVEVVDQGRKLEAAFFGLQQVLLCDIRAEHTSDGERQIADAERQILSDVVDLLRQAKKLLSTSDIWIDAHRDPKDQSYRIAIS